MKIKQLILGVLSLFVLPALNGCTDIAVSYTHLRAHET